MFKYVFGRNAELCRRLIELSLDVPIAKVEFLESQHESKDINRPGGTYFDVLATTESGELIDVEMQRDSDPGLLQRAQVYLGRLVREAWTRYVETEHSYDYTKLPKVAVIFICDYDPFGVGHRRYSARLQYDVAVEKATSPTLVVLLNAKGEGDSISTDLAAFLAYVAGKLPMPGSSEFVDSVAHEVEAANADADFLEGFMNLDEKLWRSKEDGRKEGFEQGAQKQRQQISELAARMSADGRGAELTSVLTNNEALERELRRYGIA